MESIPVKKKKKSQKELKKFKIKRWGFEDRQTKSSRGPREKKNNAR